MSQQYAIDDLLKHLDGKDGSATLTVGELVEIVNSRGFGLPLCFLSLLMILPTGAIPGMPIIMGILLSIVSFQIFLGRRSLWVPHALSEIKLKRKSLQDTLHKASPAINFIFQYTHRRMGWLFNKASIVFIALLCAVLALSMIPLGMIPFLVMVPAFLIFIFGLGLTTHDGLIITAGFGLVLACCLVLPFVI